MSARSSFALGCLGGLLATSAVAFSPGPPRPIPPNVTGVCSVAAPAEDTCGFECQGAGGICLVDPAAETILAETRAVPTLVVDEDVAPFLATSDPTPNTKPNPSPPPDTIPGGRLDNARFTLLLEFQVQGKPVAISDTFALDRSCLDDNDPGDATVPSLCVPTWAQPISEANLIANVGEFQDLQLQWAVVNANMQSALRSALLSPAQLALHPDAQPVVEIVDGGVVGFGPFTAQQVARLDQFDNSAGPQAGLASVRRFKVTIKLVVP